MNALASLALFGWPVVVAGLFLAMKPGRAALVAYTVGWLYLPLITYDLVGLPPYGKFTATNMAIVPLLLVFGGGRLWALRPSWVDLPMLVWLVTPMASSLSNGLGLWDGLSGVSDNMWFYGVPYLVGRAYLRREDDWIFLAKLVVVAAMTYVPLCLFEMRMSPQLHQWVYGVGGRVNWENYTGFGPLQWAPTVFMNSAFEVNMLMSMAALIMFWAWRTRRLRWIYGIQTPWFVAGFVIMAVLCKKWSGIGALLIGLAILGLSERVRRPIWAYALILAPVVYMALFTSGVWRGEGLKEWVEPLSERRSESLQFRIDNDRLLTEKAMERPLFGWGGWGRNRVYDDRGKDISITDSMWTITLGTRGMVGLAAATLIYILPFMLFLRRYPPRQWMHPQIAMMVPFVMILALHMIDNMFNAFPNAMYPLFAGGVSACVAAHMPRDVRVRTAHGLNGPRPPLRRCRQHSDW